MKLIARQRFIYWENTSWYYIEFFTLCLPVECYDFQAEFLRAVNVEIRISALNSDNPEDFLELSFLVISINGFIFNVSNRDIQKSRW